MVPRSPFDPLLPLLEAANCVGPTAWGTITQIEIIFSTGVRIPMVLVGQHQGKIVGVMPADGEDFDPNQLQIKLLGYLGGGPKNPKQLKLTIGNHLYDDPGGLDELVREGWVVRKMGKIKLTALGTEKELELRDSDDDETET